MKVHVTDDLDGWVIKLDAAFQIAEANDHMVDTFLDLLDEALVTLYRHAKRELCVGLEWIFLGRNAQEDFLERFLDTVPDPTDMFLEASELNPRIIDVTCSALLSLIPKSRRLDFARKLIIRQGPHCKQWISNLQTHGLDNEDITEILFDILEDENTPTAARDRLIFTLTGNRINKFVGKEAEFLLLGAEEYQIAAEICAEHNPRRVLESLQRTSWDSRDQARGFTWRINQLLGSAALEEIVSIALEANRGSSSKVDYMGQLRKRTMLSGGIEHLVSYALEKGNKQLFRSHMAACLAKSGDNLILLYQTQLYKLFHEHASELGWYIDSCIQQELVRLGWYVAHVEITMHKHRPSRHICHDGLRFVQPYGNRFFPRQGEEVLFNPTSGTLIGDGVYAVSFLKLDR
jgi:hypothetical protein